MKCAASDLCSDNKGSRRRMQIASFKSGVSNPSVNKPWTGARKARVMEYG